MEINPTVVVDLLFWSRNIYLFPAPKNAKTTQIIFFLKQQILLNNQIPAQDE